MSAVGSRLGSAGGSGASSNLLMLLAPRGKLFEEIDAFHRGKGGVRRLHEVSVCAETLLVRRIVRKISGGSGR